MIHVDNALWLLMEKDDYQSTSKDGSNQKANGNEIYSKGTTVFHYCETAGYLIK